MDFFSLKFCCFFFATIFIIYSSPDGYRFKIAFPFLNVIFILSFVNSLSAVLPLVIFLGIGFAGIRLLEKFANRTMFMITLMSILGGFIYLKKYEFVSMLPFINSAYLTVGLSYVLFRMIQMLVDIYQQEIRQQVNAFDFFNFCCNFLTFVSGPIQRYEEYLKQKESCGKSLISENEVFICFGRLIQGLLKVVLISTLLNDYYQWELAHMLGTKVDLSSFAAGVRVKMGFLILGPKFLITSCLYSLYLYFNFSGYMDIVISFGKLLGFQLPENFNRPFESRSFLELWTRWHITLAEWFKFYVFNPFLRFLSTQWPNRNAAPYLGVIAYFLTFFLMGLWHGSTWMFLIYGLFLGFGVSVNKIFDVLMRKFFNETYQKMTEHPVFGLISSAYTFVYFSMAVSCFWLNIDHFLELWAQIKLIGFLIIFMLGGIVITVVMSGVRFCAFLLRDVSIKLAPILTNFYVLRAWIAFELFIIIAYSFYGFGGIPDIVYKAF